jgi:hypothetical protein
LQSLPGHSSLLGCTDTCIDDCIAEVTATKSQLTATIYLTPARGIFRLLVSSGTKRDFADRVPAFRSPLVDLPESVTNNITTPSTTRGGLYR